MTSRWKNFLVLACVTALVPQCLPTLRGAELSESDIADYRMSQRIPDEEREMSIDDLVGLLGEKGYHWVLNAIRLRCRLADDHTRREIFDKLVAVAIQAQEIPDEFHRIARRGVVTILGEQEEHREEALGALKRMLAGTEDLLTRDACYRNMSRLGGPEAIDILKDAILAGPPETRDPWSLEGETYQSLFMYLGGCGPDAAPVLFEIALTLEREDDYRIWAALAATGNEELVVPFLLEKARTSPEWTRSRALHSACMLARSPSIPVERRREIAELLVHDVGSEEASVRNVVAWGLGEVGDETHIPLLERMAADDPHSSIIVGSKGDVEYERLEYPVRERATKSIETIRRRTAEQQAASDP